MGHLSHRQITIIGAGIAGLTVATALAQRGAQVRVLERAGALREVGAGLQISPNAVRVLARLGLWDRFEAISVRSERVELHDSAGRKVARLDLARHRPQDRFRLVHRARLVAMLEQAANVVVEMVNDLRHMNLDRMTALNEKLRSLENEADRLMLELYRDIYSGRLDNLQMFLLKEFFEILEKAIDRCREAGVVAYQIVLKHS